jgi:predicted SnoaL-like aldol condensation-catalyzing enzyme
MPTPEQNKETVAALAREVFGSKNLDHADAWLADDFVEHQVFPGTTPDKRGAIDSYRIFCAASPDMTAEIHDMVATGDASQRRRPVWTSWGSSMVRGSRPV